MLRDTFRPYGTPASEPTFAELDTMGPYAADPLLSLDELLGGVNDLRSKLPEATRQQLTADEIVVRIAAVAVSPHNKPPSNLRTLIALAGVATVGALGDNGPLIASLPASHNPADAAQNRFTSPHIRDAILASRTRRRTSALDIAPRLRHPQLMRAALLHATEKGGITEETYDAGRPFRQERPGKVMLVDFSTETSIGRKLSRYLGWGWPAFLSLDAGPLFISETADFVEQEEPDFLATTYQARDGQEHSIGQFFELAVDRLLTDLDQSREGFLEFKNLAPTGGMLNQAWADSSGAYTHSNGEWANHRGGIAPSEVQGYAYDALIKAARIFRTKFCDSRKAATLEQQALVLRQAFLEKFFATDEKGTYAVMGRDYDEAGNGRHIAVRHADMGLLLETGILDGDEPEVATKRQAIIDTLFSNDMMTKYGIRTLSASEQAYRPGGDHVGSIWPHINESVARGLIKYGYFGLAYYLRKANWLMYNETHATPEYIRGDSAKRVKHNPQMIVVWNTKYQRIYMFEIPGQRDQAWSNEAVLAGKYDYPALTGGARPKGLPKAAIDPSIAAHEAELLAELPPLTA